MKWPLPGHAEAVGDAFEQPDVEHLAAVEDLAHLGLGLPGQLRDPALAQPDPAQEAEKPADVPGRQRGAHRVVVEERGVRKLH
ncbi:MAG: hypothetical protein ACRDR6_18485 [Pseudonocardiaceae bacterium]